MIKANQYRTVSCGELREENIGQQVRVAGWVENIRDHGGVMFLDIRDEYGVLQVVVHNDELLKNINKECTVTLSGEVVKRDEETINKKIATGYVEVHTDDITVLGKDSVLHSTEIKEEIGVVLAGATIKKGQELAAGADGLAAVAVSGDYVLGIALENAEADEYVPVQLAKYQKA